MRRSRAIACGMLIGSILTLMTLPVFAQDAQQTPSSQGQLTLSTPYPAQSVEVGTTVTLSLTVRADELPAQVVRLSTAEMPDGWSGSFLGNGRTVQAVYVAPDSPGSVTLRLEPSQDIQPGTYNVTAVAHAQASDVRAELPLELTVQEQLPPQLALDVELPTLQGTPNGTVTYQATLANEGDRDLTVNLSSDAPENFEVSFTARFENQTVTSLPVGAGESRDLSIEVAVPQDIAAGDHQIGVQAEAEGVRETQILTASIEGQPDLSVTTSGGPVSAQATIGATSSVDFVVRNRGSAPAQNVSLSASSPSGWTVEFQPSTIGAIEPGGQAQATAQISPSGDTIAGDYFVTLTARAEGNSASREFRITAQRSTIWGAVGIGLIAVALGVVGLAVVRYGRR